MAELTFVSYIQGKCENAKNTKEKKWKKENFSAFSY